MESNGGEPDTETNKETDDEESNNEEAFEEFLEDKSDQRKRTNTSISWDYFDIKDRERRVATCKLCSCECSYWSSVSNLMKHVRRKHLFALNTDQLDRSSSPPSRQHASKGVIRSRSSLWNYCKIIDRSEKLAMCLLCKKQLSYRATMSNLKKHLNNKHPHLMNKNDDKRVIISSDGQLYEIEETKSDVQNDDNEGDPTLDIDSVFIDDFEGDLIESRSKKRKLERKEEKKRKKIVIEDTGHSDNTSSDEITFQKRYVRKKNDSLDQFGKYLISLMKQLPKELSNQLQIDFVKQVMTAQFTYDTQQKRPAPNTIQNNGYAITITDNGPQNTSDHQYVVEEHVVESQ